MNYWWVNHKQTYFAEVNGGYIWSPKQEKNGVRSQFYDNMTLTQPGDMIFSYADTKIKAIGIVSDECRESSQPVEFGKVGSAWAALGWLVPIEWRLLNSQITPKDHIDLLRPLLPGKYSPINEKGLGNQKCYLANISQTLANQVIAIGGEANQGLINELFEIADESLSDKEQKHILATASGVTEKEQLIKARLGQGLFRLRLTALEQKCRVTGVENLALLIASHIKPWRVSSNYERLDGNNGLLLSPHIDKLFDRGWITFGNLGEIYTANEAVISILRAWGVNPNARLTPFTPVQQEYLAYHREFIFKKESEWRGI